MAGISVRIEIPLPPACLHAHNKGHWSAKSNSVKLFRNAARMRAKSYLARTATTKPIACKVRIHHEWFLAKTPLEAALGDRAPKSAKRYRPADEGNAIQALKPAIDGLVDAGLLFDDRAKYVTWGDFKRLSAVKQHQGRSCVVLTLTEVECEG